jgi:hypothetical protein
MQIIKSTIALIFVLLITDLSVQASAQNEQSLDEL